MKTYLNNMIPLIRSDENTDFRSKLYFSREGNGERENSKIVKLY